MWRLTPEASAPADHAPADVAPRVPRLQLQGLRSAHAGPFDLTLAAGECVAVSGRSGAGKSVLLRLIADLDPNTGEVDLDGKPRAGWPAPAWRRQVLYQAAEPAWWAPTAAAHLQGVDVDRAMVDGLLEQLGLLPETLDAEISRLSTGERQRLALLRSLAHRPRVLLLDEPTASLDPAATLAVEAVLLAERLRQGLSILIVTHSVEQALRVARRRFEVRDRTLHAL